MFVVHSHESAWMASAHARKIVVANWCERNERSNAELSGRRGGRYGGEEIDMDLGYNPQQEEDQSLDVGTAGALPRYTFGTGAAATQQSLTGDTADYGTASQGLVLTRVRTFCAVFAFDSAALCTLADVPTPYQ